mgnify:CR=1 FL=1
MTLWIAVTAAGLATFGVRLLSLAYLPPNALPPLARDALRFVLPAVLSAIIVPAVLFVGDDDRLALPPDNVRLVAAVVAAGVAWLGQGRLPAGRAVWLTIAAGMATLWALEAAR